MNIQWENQYGDSTSSRSRSDAESLARMVAQFWRNAGFFNVEVGVECIGHDISKVTGRTFHVLRSNLSNGLPPCVTADEAAKAYRLRSRSASPHGGG